MRRTLIAAFLLTLSIASEQSFGEQRHGKWMSGKAVTRRTQDGLMPCGDWSPCEYDFLFAVNGDPSKVVEMKYPLRTASNFIADINLGQTTLALKVVRDKSCDKELKQYLKDNEELPATNVQTGQPMHSFPGLAFNHLNPKLGPTYHLACFTVQSYKPQQSPVH